MNDGQSFYIKIDHLNVVEKEEVLKYLENKYSLPVTVIDDVIKNNKFLESIKNEYGVTDMRSFDAYIQSEIETAIEDAMEE